MQCWDSKSCDIQRAPPGVPWSSGDVSPDMQDAVMYLFAM